MNTAIIARAFFFVMAAFMLIGFTAAAQEKTPEKEKSGTKREKIESAKHHRHTQKAIKAKKAEQEKKAMMKKENQPK